MMHQASFGRFLGPRGSAAARHEREVETHRDVALRLGLAWLEKGRKVGALVDRSCSTLPFTAPFAMESGRS
eukprot:1081963-Amphidinium_carterae.1